MHISKTVPLVILSFSCLLQPLIGQVPGRSGADRAPTSQPATPPAEPVLTAHELVEVTMDNGSVFRGVVFKGRYVEKPRRSDFVQLDESAKHDVGAGIRLWYYQDLQGFMFLQYRNVDTITILGRLTDVDLSRHKDRANAKAKVQVAAGATAAKPAANAAKQAAAAPTSGMAALDVVQRALIERFPPTAGWNPELYASIQRSLVVDGKPPTLEQDEWIAVYPEWLAAWKVFAGKADAPASAKASVAKRAPETGSTAKPAAPAKKEPTGSTVPAKSRESVEIKAPEGETKEQPSGPKRRLN